MLPVGVRNQASLNGRFGLVIAELNPWFQFGLSGFMDRCSMNINIFGNSWWTQAYHEFIFLRAVPFVGLGY